MPSKVKSKTNSKSKIKIVNITESSKEAETFYADLNVLNKLLISNPKQIPGKMVNCVLIQMVLQRQGVYLMDSFKLAKENLSLNPYACLTPKELPQNKTDKNYKSFRMEIQPQIQQVSQAQLKNKRTSPVQAGVRTIVHSVADHIDEQKIQIIHSQGKLQEHGSIGSRIGGNIAF